MNNDRDENNRKAQVNLNWRVLTVWKWTVRSESKLEFGQLISTMESCLSEGDSAVELRGMFDFEPN